MSREYSRVNNVSDAYLWDWTPRGTDCDFLPLSLLLGARSRVAAGVGGGGGGGGKDKVPDFNLEAVALSDAIKHSP